MRRFCRFIRLLCNASGVSRLYNYSMVDELLAARAQGLS